MTEKERTEAGLHNSEEEYRLFFMSNPLPMWVYDLETLSFLTVNDAAIQLLGYSREEFLGMTIKDIRPGEDTQSLMNLIKELKKSEDMKRSSECRYMKKDGSIFFAEIVSRNITFEGRSSRLLLANDISSRKRVEQVAQEMMRRLQAVMDYSPAVVYVKDLKGRHMISNLRLEKILHKSREDIIGKKDHELIQNDVADEVRKNDQIVIAEGRPICVEEEIRHDDGVHTYLTTKFPLMDERGRPYAVGGIALDITDRKEAERELKASEERFRNIFEEGPLGISIIGQEKRFLKVNQVFSEMMGYSEEELKQMTFLDITHPEQLEDDEEIHEKLVAGAIPFHKAEKRYVKKNNEVFWGAVSVAVIRDDGGRHLFNLAMVEDITERKLTEHALKESEEKFRTLADQSPNMIFINRGGKVIYVNKKCEDIMGFSREEFYSPEFSYLSLITPDSLELVKASFQKHMVGSEVEPYEYGLIAKDGRRLDVIITTKLISYEGETAILGIVTDISERKRGEEEIRRYRNQLRSLMYRLAVVEEQERRKISEELHDNIGQNLALGQIKLTHVLESHPEVSEELESVRELIENVMSYSRSLIYELSPPILHEFGIEATIKWLIRQMRDKYGLRVDFESCGANYHMDEEISVLIYKTLRELVVNIIKHAQAARVVISMKKSHSNVIINVIDDGIGFDTSSMDSLSTTSSSYGLFSIRERMKYLKGSMEISSKPDNGTRVKLVFPLGRK
jgi:PAS domain S-box-containing protein